MNQLAKIIAILCVFWSASSSAASEGSKKRDGKPDVPQLVFDSPMIDFGRIKRGEKRTHAFKFKNLGLEPVRIVGAHAACGCTMTSIPEKAVAANGVGEVEITLDTIQHRGSLLKTVLILTDEAIIPERILTIKAVIDDEISVDPPVANWGNTDATKLPQTRILKVSGVQGFPLVINGLRYNKSYFDAQFEKTSDGYSVAVTLKPAAPFGSVRETLEIQSNSKFLPRVPVPLVGEIAYSVSSNPGYVNFGQLAQGRHAERTIALASSSDFELKSMDGDIMINGEPLNNWRDFIEFKVEDQNNSSKNKQVRVSLKNNGMQSGAVHGQLYFFTSNANERVDVDLYALVVDEKGN